MKIVWNEQERAEIFRHARTFGPPERGDSAEIWRKMQEVLPSGRRRPFDPMTMALVNAERKKGRLPPKAAAPPEEAVPAPTLATPEPPPPVAIEPPEEVSVATLIVDTILRTLYDPRLREALRSLVAEALLPESELEQSEAITWRAPTLGKERKPRVVIVGGQTQMREQLRNLPNVDLRFWGLVQGESPARLNAILQNANLAVVIVSNVRHYAMHSVKDREKLGRIKAIYWTRPLSELRASLETLTWEKVQGT